MENNGILLHKCVSSGDVVAVRRLIEQRENLNAEDCHGNCATHHASRANQVEILLLLLNSGADVNIVNEEGCTALHVAVENGHEKCVSALLNQNIQVNRKNKAGLTELMVAMKIDDRIDTANRNRTIEHLLNFPKINTRRISSDQFKQTALHYAAQYGNVFAVNRLLKQDSSLYSVRNSVENLAIHNAACYGQNEIVREFHNIFPKFGININGRNWRTPLQLAIICHKYSTIELLIALNADCNEADRDGNTALHTAINVFNLCCYKQWPCTINCEKQVDHGQLIEEIQKSLSTTVQKKCYSLAVVLFLIEKGNANINAENKVGKTPVDLVAHDKLVSNFIKSFCHQKMGINSVQYHGKSEVDDLLQNHQNTLNGNDQVNTSNFGK